MRPKDKGQGYTLVEMLVAMLIFSVVMTLISASFARTVKNSSQLSKNTETDIAGLIGLEVMRSDLELAGFGLPWSVSTDIHYDEALKDWHFVTACTDGCPGAKASLYNDNPPSAYRVGDNVGFNGSDYLVLKGTPLGNSPVCRSWCYVNYSGFTRPSRVTPELDQRDEPRVVVLKNEVFSGKVSRTLVHQDSKFTVSSGATLDHAFSPTQKTDTYLAYGVAETELRFPFNRSDYYIERGTDRISSFCNEGTGILYKAGFNHQAKPTIYPLLDCVADMQVVLYLDSNNDGVVDYHPTAEDTLTPKDLREGLKQVRVYVLAQQGKRDTTFVYPAETIVVGDPNLPDEPGHVWSAPALAARFGANWRNYHWKVYTIVVQPKNL
ncbi:PilW family protein [Geomonas ferrireducens]|uniref:PilW family protein n=1 Tax=Geomonas ferrireducens TaxID=2570227 RepID=UPI0010A7E3C3|nr:prepilin-type N-terminal cleavage/methylation domain-containing protein [Geomonas ferrireducens]